MATQTAASRLASALQKYCLARVITSPKITCLACNLEVPSLGLCPSALSMLKADTTHIIHCAWNVNFALPLQCFRPDLAGLQNLLALSLTTTSRPEPAQVVFCSSIAAALGTIPPALIPQTTLGISKASATGYGRSKAIAEHIVERAVRDSGVSAKIVRIGQIVPSRKEGASKLWNVNEMIPLLIRSALTIEALPDTLNGGDSCDWIEVNVVSRLICGVAGLSREVGPGRDSELLYNAVHPIAFSWRDEFLPKLRKSGLVFQIVGYEEWLQQLHGSEVDLVKNPSRKLLGFWKTPRQGEHGEIKFDTSAKDQTSVSSLGQLRAVEGDLVTELVAAWMKAWENPAPTLMTKRTT